MKILLFLLVTISLFARSNPFIPVVTNENDNVIKKQLFQKKVIQLPSDARVLKSVIFEYQTLTGSIKQQVEPINKAIDWHIPIKITTKTDKQQNNILNIKTGFLGFKIDKHNCLIKTQNPIIREFLLVKPFRYVIDFQANKNFLTYSKKVNSFVKKIVLGNHSGFYRVVLYLDGTYKITTQKVNKGYLVEFR